MSEKTHDLLEASHTSEMIAIALDMGKNSVNQCKDGASFSLELDAAAADLRNFAKRYRIEAVNRCERKLKIGMSKDQLPADCEAHLARSSTTARGTDEQWEYIGGGLWFTDGRLAAIEKEGVGGVSGK